MITLMRAIIAAAAALQLVACGDNLAAETDGGTDAGVDVDVDADLGPIAVLGTGYEAFEPMPEVLMLEYGAQGGYHLMAHVWMSGLTPGNAKDVFDPANPRTRIHASFADSGIPLDFYAHAQSPKELGYAPTANDGYQLARAVPIIFETCWRSNHLYGSRIKIELEVKDVTGRIATDVKIVIAAEPLGGGIVPDPPGTPGCDHDYRPFLDTGYPSKDTSPAVR
jgi:hypothetical protein